MFVCKECKYGYLGQKDAFDWTKEDEQTFLKYCADCFQWDQYECRFIAINFDNK